VFDLAAANDAVMNLVIGDFDVAIHYAIATGANRIDHNSVHLRLGNGTALMIISANPQNDFCLRNNIFAGNAASVGVDFSNATRIRSCDGVGSGSNSVVAHGTTCQTRCIDCDGNGPACDLSIDPGFTSDDLCLPPGNGLIDEGRDVGADMVDGDPADWLGTAPEVGAREAGSTRTYGGSVSTCP
jgi:hypothetical protein